jgi:hypothetical protein
MFLSFSHQMEAVLATLPDQFFKEIKAFFTTIDMRLGQLKEKMEMIIDGTRKREVCDWWLNYIEINTDDFLKRKGFVFSSLPNNYLSEAPQDVELVKRNLGLIQQLMRVDCRDTLELLMHLTTQVYTVLDELISDTALTLEYKTKYEGESEGMFQGEMDSLKKDMQYLLKMKAMDEEIQRRKTDGVLGHSSKLEMTDVVPVGGLVMAHLHIIECELQTALEIWSPGVSNTEKVSTTWKSQHPKKEMKLESMRFHSFIGEATIQHDPIRSRVGFTDFVNATRPTFASEECIQFALLHSKSFYGKKKQVRKTDNRTIRMGVSRDPSYQG